MLPDLNRIALKTQKDIEENVVYSEIKLSEEFKTAYSTFLHQNNREIVFYNSIALYTNEAGQNISFPNNWFMIAYYLVDYRRALLEYKDHFSKIFAAEDKGSLANRLYSIQSNQIPEDILNKINSAFSDEEERGNFKKFLTNQYVWWFGQKKIDRGDFYVSALLKMANLIIESSAYVSTISKELLHNSELYKSFAFENIKVDRISKAKLTNKIDISVLISDLNSCGLIFSKDIIIRFVSALLTKPFVILTGLSGSGKTKLAQAFTQWITEDEKQYCIAPVGADWTNREPLLGFPNALESDKYVMPDNGVLQLLIEANKPENVNKPYFLILDEMNLSHVERYFADFLSSMESKDAIKLHANEALKEVPKEIILPSNLFIIGTVNIDETTYMFSPKVLDRANVIEFRVTDKEMRSYLGQSGTIDLKALKGVGSGIATDFIALANDNNITIEDKEAVTEELLEFFVELKKLGAEFGYRSAAEMLRFIGIVKELEVTWSINQTVDAAIMQKLLPKVHGSRKKLAPVLESIGSLCLKDGHNISEIFADKAEPNYDAVAEYPISLEKINRMYRNLIENGFTSYAEA